MKTISFKSDDSVFTETEQLITHIKKSRNRYINEALDFYNKVQKRKLLASKLEKESKLVEDESLAVLHEFELIDYAWCIPHGPLRDSGITAQALAALLKKTK